MTFVVEYPLLLLGLRRDERRRRVMHPQWLVVHIRRTRGVTEAMVIALIVSSAILWAGVAWGQIAGLYIAQAAFTLGGLAQMLWLWYRSRAILQ